MTDFLPAVGDLLWPRRCAVAGCGRRCDRRGSHLCSACFAALPWNEPGGACRICGAPVAAETRHKFLCESCAKRPPAFELAAGAMIYAGDLKQLILDFKFRSAIHLAADFAAWTEGAVRTRLDAAAIDLVLPVPLHPGRMRERAYNQSALVAEPLAARLGRRFDPHSLVRRFDTQHQTRLANADERRKNLRGAFAVAAGREGFVCGRTVLVVDDVMTTGTTLEHCARALKEAGARRVWCATVARSR